MADAFTTFPHLLAPIKIGGVMFRNRMLSAPLGSAEIVDDGQPSMDTVRYLERKAMGGAASINWGEVDVDPEEFQKGNWPREITRNGNFNYARLASAVKLQGAVPCIELCFSGAHSRFYGPGPGGKMTAWGPVDTTMMMGYKVEAMPEKKILEVIDGFARAAMAAKQAGFEMICLHGAHGFGLQQFMSPSMNTRTDDWGGNAENRCRFAVETIKAVKKLCGKDFPVEIRISGSEIVPDGYGIDEGIRIAEQLDGFADIIHVSVGAINRFGSETFARTHLSMFYPHGRNVEYADAIKKHVSKSLIGTVGGLSDPYQMEEILASGKADLIYIARGLVADPDLPNKVRSGKPETIRRCMRCLNCFAEGVAHGDLVCAINPEISRESEVYRALPKSRTRCVLVVGGGIAGMQAALTARQNGHEVILCEKSGELGGQILCERDVPFKARLHDYIELQKSLLTEAGVTVRLNTEVTPEYARLQNADSIIVAIGAKPLIPPIPGIERALHAIDVFNKPSLAKGKTVILGAGFVGTELAIYLKSSFGVDVEIVETGFGINHGGNSTHAQAVEDALERHKIAVHFNCKATEINDSGCQCESTADGSRVFYPAETVICATGMVPRQQEAAEFYDCAADFAMVGDCRKAANILAATSAAYTTARYTA